MITLPIALAGLLVILAQASVTEFVGVGPSTGGL